MKIDLFGLFTVIAFGFVLYYAMVGTNMISIGG